MYLDNPSLKYAQVTNLNDPEEKGRIEICYLGTSIPVWAKITTVHPNRGNDLLFGLDEEVMVDGYDDEQSAPVIVAIIEKKGSRVFVYEPEGNLLERTRIVLEILDTSDGTFYDMNDNIKVKRKDGREYHVSNDFNRMQIIDSGKIKANVVRKNGKTKVASVHGSTAVMSKEATIIRVPRGQNIFMNGQSLPFNEKGYEIVRGEEGTMKVRKIAD